jgi:hypothetical protein
MSAAVGHTAASRRSMRRYLSSGDLAFTIFPDGTVQPPLRDKQIASAEFIILHATILSPRMAAQPWSSLQRTANAVSVRACGVISSALPV